MNNSKQPILLATTSPGKLAQYKEVINELFPKGVERDFRLLTLKSTRFLKALTAAPEEADTTQEVATAKALHYALLSKLPVIVDDDGLYVDALRGEPGVRSYHDWYPEKVLRVLQTTACARPIRAHMQTTCVAATFDWFEGNTIVDNGFIAYHRYQPSPKAYGYDDIFIPACRKHDNKTYYEWLCEARGITHASINYPRSVVFSKTFLSLLAHLGLNQSIPE